MRATSRRCDYASRHGCDAKPADHPYRLALWLAVPSVVGSIWPADDRRPMGSDAPRSVGTMRATNRTVVPITVMARTWLANSRSPVGADTSSPIDSIDTGGCVTWLGEHERAKSHHEGNHRCATPIEAQY